MLCLYLLVKYRLPAENTAYYQSLSLKTDKLAVLAGFVADGSKQVLVE